MTNLSQTQAAIDAEVAQGLPRRHLWACIALYPVTEEQVGLHLQGDTFALDSTTAEVKGPLCYACEKAAEEAAPTCPGDVEG